MKQTNQKIWCISSVLTLILLFFVSLTYAQPTLPTISGGKLYVSPVQNQLYPRNTTTNNGTVIISGKMRFSSRIYTSIRRKIYRDNNGNGTYGPGEQLGGVATQTIALDGPVVADSVSFLFTNFSLPAELFNYRFEVVGVETNGSETILAGINNVVAGDVFVIQGQSNSYAEKRSDGDANAEPNRNFIRSYGSSHPDGYSFSPNSWGIADGNTNNKGAYNVGMWGMRLASRLTQSEGIPIAILCGGFGNYILAFQKIWPFDPAADDSNNYLRLQKRINDAGLANGIRAFFWWQGESDGIINNPNPTSKADYIFWFNELLDDWKTDFPGFSKVFIAQIRLGCYVGTPPINSALDIMQAQLDIAKSDNNIEILSTQNLEHIFETGGDIPSPGWYCHYGYSNGYRKAADLFLPTVQQELYGEPEGANTRFGFPTAADITSTGVPATQVTVELNNLNDTYSIVPLGTDNIKDYFRIEGGGGGYVVTGVSIQGRSIRINFDNPNGNVPTAVSYFGRQQFEAPVIQNSGGHAIVAFTQPIVPNSLPADPLSLTVSRNGSAHQLRWKAESNERFDHFVVEKGETRNTFKAIQDVFGTGQNGTVQYDFTDNKPNANVSHYRIRAVQMDGKELFSQVVTVNNRLNNVKEFRVYPNPVAGSANATINMNESSLATINLHDASGRLLSSRKLQLQKGNNQFSLGELLDYNPGTYIVRVITATETQQLRVVKAK